MPFLAIAQELYEAREFYMKKISCFSMYLDLMSENQLRGMENTELVRMFTSMRWVKIL